MKHSMHGKHLESPPADLPHPKAEKIGGHHGPDKPIKSPPTASMGMNHHEKTPDMMGRLFDHKPNARGV